MREGETPDGTIELVSGIIDDTRELLSAHADALRLELGERVSTLGAALRSSLIALTILIVSAVLLGLSIAATLVAIGLPLWASLWIVTGLALASALVVALDARANARSTAEGSPTRRRARRELAGITDLTRQGTKQRGDSRDHSAQDRRD